MRPTILRLALCIVMISTTCKAEQPTVFWFRSDFAPGSIVSGPDKDRGYLDQLTTAIEKHLPNYRHPWVTAPVSRIQEEMKIRPNACNPAFLKTPEREALFVFSAPYIELLPNGLIVNRASLPPLKPFLSEKGAVHLGDLLASHLWHVAIVAGRSYGDGINAALKANADSGLVIAVQSADLFSTSLRKLAEHRDLDGVIGYGSELDYAVKLQGYDPAKFVFVPVAEEPPLIASHVACSRSPFGEAFIAEVNALIASSDVQSVVLAAYRSWLPPDTVAYYDRLRRPLPQAH